ncbi:MAG: aminotransferase class IV [Lunatimonas sp.]|uniref:aminotransferase class IV n=1 Tax=Lunatimonas sp. TaxID=2060141 RepID=UPI002A3E0C6E|nr:aminotransferase class IV [Lunatimonas sp.]
MNGIDTVYLEKDLSGGWLLGKQPTRAAFFGDGIFETMVFANGSIRFGTHHQARVRDGLRVLQLRAKGPNHFASLEQSLRNTVGSEGLWRVRWNLYRDGLGKYTPAESHIRESVYIQPFHPAPTVKRSAAISQSVKLFPTPWANCKTLNALPYVMANLERVSMGLDEILLTDAEGYLSEAGAANLFWVKEGSFYTPSLSHNCIAGVARRALIEHLDKKSIPIYEGSFFPQALKEAETAFTTNVTGISYIERFDDSVFDTSPIPSIEPIFSIH